MNSNANFFATDKRKTVQNLPEGDFPPDFPPDFPTKGLFHTSPSPEGVLVAGGVSVGNYTPWVQMQFIVVS